MRRRRAERERRSPRCPGTRRPARTLWGDSAASNAEADSADIALATGGTDARGTGHGETAPFPSRLHADRPRARTIAHLAGGEIIAGSMSPRRLRSGIECRADVLAASPSARKASGISGSHAMHRRRAHRTHPFASPVGVLGHDILRSRKQPATLPAGQRRRRFRESRSRLHLDDRKILCSATMSTSPASVRRRWPRTAQPSRCRAGRPRLRIHAALVGTSAAITARPSLCGLQGIPVRTAPAFPSPAEHAGKFLPPEAQLRGRP